MKVKKIPLRTCVACKAVKDKRELLRIVRDKDGNISVDKTGKSAGRGAYICKDAECFKKVRKQKVLNRVFGQEVSDAVYDAVEEAIIEK